MDRQPADRLRGGRSASAAGCSRQRSGRTALGCTGGHPVRGHEQAGRRPVLVVSEDLFNQGPAALAIVLPMTSTIRNVPSHVPVAPPEGGVRSRTAILCEGIRSISAERLVARWGAVGRPTMTAVGDRLRILLRL